MMIYATINGNGRIFDNYADLHTATFSPDIDITDIIEFKITGKSYAERRERCRELAIEFQHAAAPGLYYSDVANVTAFLEKNARRYGLLTEFKENGII